MSQIRQNPIPLNEMRLLNKNSILAVNSLIKNSSYTHVHIMFNDKFLKDFVNFLNKYFDINKHLIIVQDTFLFEPPQGENVYIVNDIGCLDLSLENVKQVIWHSLFGHNYVSYLFKHKDVLAKSCWKAWGGDLSKAPRNEVDDYVRAHFQSYIISQDTSFLLENYPVEHKNFFSTFYFNGGDAANIGLLKRDNFAGKRILINNSCDESTLEVLLFLSKFKEETVEISTILSYGDLKYKYMILKKGKELFNEKFKPITDYLPQKDYYQLLADNDILVLNQTRAQGFGNIAASLLLGKKVYMRSEVTTTNFLSEHGVTVFATQDIMRSSFEEFTLLSSELKEKNKKQIYDFFYDINKVQKKWQEVFAAV